ncbi:hypothetical protein Q5P01_000161 [Channa striata]|uniref:Uncharacterized protein n=1 Tax=Channa striata TaxID=64152 RepID=A0AA88IJ57_CHASR|nr:hypothetical protein Q5P01_000161 [Channa striata]
MATQVWNSTLGFSILYSVVIEAGNWRRIKAHQPQGVLRDLGHRAPSVDPLLARYPFAWGVNIDIRCDFHHHAVKDTRSSLNKITSGGRIRSRTSLKDDDDLASDLGAVAAPSPRVHVYGPSVADRQVVLLRVDCHTGAVLGREVNTQILAYVLVELNGRTLGHEDATLDGHVIELPETDAGSVSGYHQVRKGGFGGVGRRASVRFDLAQVSVNGVANRPFDPQVAVRALCERTVRFVLQQHVHRHRVVVHDPRGLFGLRFLKGTLGLRLITPALRGGFVRSTGVRQRRPVLAGSLPRTDAGSVSGYPLALRGGFGAVSRVLAGSQTAFDHQVVLFNERSPMSFSQAEATRCITPKCTAKSSPRASSERWHAAPGAAVALTVFLDKVFTGLGQTQDVLYFTTWTGNGENLMPHMNAIKEQANFFPKNRLVVDAGTMEHVKNTGSLENTKVVMDLDADVFAKAKARVTKGKDPRVAQELDRFYDTLQEMYDEFRGNNFYASASDIMRYISFAAYSDEADHLVYHDADVRFKPLSQDHTADLTSGAAVKIAMITSTKRTDRSLEKQLSFVEPSYFSNAGRGVPDYTQFNSDLILMRKAAATKTALVIGLSS